MEMYDVFCIFILHDFFDSEFLRIEFYLFSSLKGFPASSPHVVETGSVDP
jgi:hypothetical protein